MMRIMLARYILLLTAMPAAAQSPVFDSEIIEIWIYGDSSRIRGEYSFFNPGDTPIQRTLYFPFEVSTSPYPDSVRVRRVGSSNETPFRKVETGIHFPISLPRFGTSIYEVTYWQRTPSNTIRYILTTTRSWRKPLSKADYIIHIPAAYQMAYLSLRHDSLSIGKDHHTYMIHREDFMPGKDLLVKWKEVAR